MYGYIRFYADELKMKDLARFKAYYCGLCHQLKEGYGQKARLLLSYDMTFMAIFLDSLTDKEPELSKGFCPVSPFKKKPMLINSESLNKAALLTILMGYYNLDDAWQDDRAYSAGIAKAVFKGAFAKAIANDPPTAKTAEAYLTRFYAGEKEKNIDLDTLTDPFAGLVAEIMALNAPEELKPQLRKMGYHAGRWLYLIDALDDLPKDVEEGKFNAFTATLPYEAKDWHQFYLAAAEDIYANLFFSLEELCKIFTTLPLKRNKELIENIFFLGIRGISEIITERRQKGDPEKFATPFKIRTSCSHDATIKE
ncbi:MAG: DUF5685 family protein [Bacillota bacterium]|nr:DUF5685 family protein [Bacillota bacterium]